MNNIERRSHQPKCGMCQSCVKINLDCSHLAFEEMKVIKICTDGVKVVKCTDFVRRLNERI